MKIIKYMKNEIDLKKVSTRDLMNEVSRRNDVLVVGNWYFKQHIIDKMTYLGIPTTKENIKRVFEEKDLGLESARDDLEDFLLQTFES